jgi:ligand-binding sensor domain-containing protein
VGAYLLGTTQSKNPLPAASAVKAIPAPTAPPQASGDFKHPPTPDGNQNQLQPANNGRFTHFRVGNRNVKAMYADGDLMWVGTSGGVVRYEIKQDSYRLFDNKSGLLSNGVFYVGRVQGRLTVGTYGGGFSIYDEQKDIWDNFNIQHGLGDAFVYDVLEAKNGDVWVATWSGVNRIKGGKFTDRKSWDLYTVDNTKGGLPNDWVYGLDEGANGDIWLATEGGLAKFSNGKWDNWSHEDGVGAPYDLVKADNVYENDPAKVSSHHARQKQEQGLDYVNTAYNPNYIVSLHYAQDGTVWVGTWGGGLARFDGKSWKNYTVKDGLPGNHVFMLHKDESGGLWVGTNAGLAKMDGDKFSVMTQRDGLFANNVFSMATAPDGTLWVGSFGGVAQIRQN